MQAPLQHKLHNSSGNVCGPLDQSVHDLPLLIRKQDRWSAATKDHWSWFENENDWHKVSMKKNLKTETPCNPCNINWKNIWKRCCPEAVLQALTGKIDVVIYIRTWEDFKILTCKILWQMCCFFESVWQSWIIRSVHKLLLWLFLSFSLLSLFEPST